MIGIYRIRNLINDKCYYGSSKEIEKRWKRHENELRNNKHNNVILQRAWNKYGSENFIFEILQECKESELLELEQTYLDKNPEYNIGIHSSGGDNLSKNPNRDKIIKNITKGVQDRYLKMTNQERIDKYGKLLDKNTNWKGGVSIAYCKTCSIRISGGAVYCKDHVIYDRAKEKNAFFGKKHSEETCKIISEKRKGKKPSNIKKMCIEGSVYEGLYEASIATGIKGTTIWHRIHSKNKKYENYKYID